MSRSVLYDITPFCRSSVQDVGGVDRVAFAYGVHFASSSRAEVRGAYFGARAPHVINRKELKAIVENTERAWRDDIRADADPALACVLNWLEHARPNTQALSGLSDFGSLRMIERARRTAFHVRHWISSSLRPLPADTIYLNVFNAGRERPFLFDWLKHHSGVRPVFFVHDLLPLDYPEYFRPGHVELTRRRLETITSVAAAYITSTNVVRDRLLDLLRARGHSNSTIHVAPLPSPLPDPMRNSIPVSRSSPYFVVIGTIEPRKNHLLLLNLWRQFAAQGGNVPKLIAVGGPGWENELVHDMFERCVAIKPHVFKVDRISRAGLTQLLAGAQALLMPSFDEGYGLPVVEALTLGTPVIASDIPVFREIAHGCATLLGPLDGIGWGDAIRALCDPQSAAWGAAKAKTSQFCAPDWHDYFSGVEDFLDSLC